MAGVTASAYLDLLKSGDYSDFTILCQGIEFKVYRAVVYPASTMLKTACNGDFEEATSGKIDLSEDDPKIVSRVVLFMYTSDYDAAKIPAFLLPGQAEEPSSTTKEEANNSSSNLAKFPAPAVTPKTRKTKTHVRRPMTTTAKGRVTATTFEALKINALVYKCADFLGIENLKMLAAERFLVDARVAFFGQRVCQTACNGGFKEATSGKIEFPEDDPEIMARVVLFMYTSDYDADKVPSAIMPDSWNSPAHAQEETTEDPTETTATEKSSSSRTVSKNTFETLTINALVYKCADMLGIENLKALSAERFLTDCRLVYTEEQFAAPLQVMCESTRSDDEHLQLPVTSFCIKNDSLIPASSAEVINEHEHNVWTIYFPLFLEGLNGKTEDEIKRKTLEDVAFLQARYCDCDKLVNRFKINHENKVAG